MRLEKIFFILVFITPLVIIPQMELGWEVGKIYWLWTILLSWLSYRLIVKKTIWRSNALWYSLAIWLLVMLVSTQINGDSAFWGGWWRRQGWWFMGFLCLLWSLVSTTELPKKIIGKIFLITAGLSVVLGITNLSLYSGGIFEANNVGLIAALMIIAIQGQKNLSGWIIGFAGLLLSQSRSGIAALAVLVKRISVKYAVMLVVLGVVFLIASWSRGGGERWQVWTDSLTIWSRSPWLGIGLDNYYEAYTTHMKSKGIELVKFDQPHNLILWLLLSVGSIGTAAFLGWIYLVMSRSKERIWKDMIVAILIFGLFQPLSSIGWIYLFTFLGVVCADS